MNCHVHKPLFSYTLEYVYFRVLALSTAAEICYLHVPTAYHKTNCSKLGPASGRGHEIYILCYSIIAWIQNNSHVKLCFELFHMYVVEYILI